ncbi:lipoprotein-anchoring transpeptidase ErfK/SrfK [Longimicrobium terrae]|uniref:Lipoprotein-anchoring transpeptidase ErfK/SrfK n=2 Tax=Longimicrobium terrae TaxID=1639882 RepID=A0A841GZK9_9BACT|nr:L,D-transpeptidase [Longimicrobium terrae]MBB4636852.1 lipoprotein-anchoring transpeptidase ErfK/SrfK [Longimicrobium terrae]MBB6071148.1 lipoprotein-anchoring transpeptidase ErfK/SrfK [Longimicrobium terrae]NNC29197.1 L,D-transpeptidase [Longimicrobium terrae]
MRSAAGMAMTLSVLALSGCVVKDSTDDDAGNAAQTTTAAPAPTAGTAQAPATPAPAAQPAQPAVPASNLRLEVNVAERELYVYRGDERVSTHKVAVGTSEWPTRTGEWTIGQVVWNPRWIPPTEQSWAEDREPKEPGDPDNPLGRAQLVYDAPRSIHGTNQPASLGKAASHGSIRIANSDAIALARLVMEEGGAGKDDAWYERVQANRRERMDIAIPNPIPIRVVSGSGGGESGGSSGSEKEKDKSGA